MHLARLYHRRSLILRRNFPQLQSSLIDKSKEWFHNSEYYNVGDHVWRFPDGVLIRFGHVENDDNAKDWDGSEYDLLAFDQLEQFTKVVYEHLYTIPRSADRAQRVRIVSTANPFGENIDWIIERWRYWVDEGASYKAKPGEVLWFAKLENKDVHVENGKPFVFKGELVYPKSRTYIPAVPADNPYLDETYMASLQQMDEPFRSQALYGKWMAGAGDDPYQVIPSLWLKQAVDRWEETNPYPKDSPVFAMDVAHGGEDETDIAALYNQWFDRIEVHRGTETPDGNSAAALMKKRMINGGTAIVDAWSWGASAYENLRDSNLNVFPFGGGMGSGNTDKSGQWKFKNLITEAYWRFREALDPKSEFKIALPPDEGLRTELSARRYKFDKDWIILEPKETMKKRIGRSPNKADAVVIGWYARQLGQAGAIEFSPNQEYTIAGE